MSHLHCTERSEVHVLRGAQFPGTARQGMVADRKSRDPQRDPAPPAGCATKQSRLRNGIVIPTLLRTLALRQCRRVAVQVLLRPARNPGTDRRASVTSKIDF